jgi:heme ABC exporter ATP-binding subunit CcmA
VSEPNAIVSLSGVAVRAGSVTILRDLDFGVAPGEAVGVFGANGAGKTTLLRLIASLLRPSAGAATVFGADLGGPARYGIRHRIGYIGHTPGWYPELTLSENLGFLADVMGCQRTRVDDTLAAVGLEGAKDRRADRCSHGMQRRAEFARVLMTEPDLLLLDEPHSALDADAVDLVDDLVRSTVSRGGAAILVSHDRSRVEALVDRTHVISEGSLR